MSPSSAIGCYVHTWKMWLHSTLCSTYIHTHIYIMFDHMLVLLLDSWDWHPSLLLWCDLGVCTDTVGLPMMVFELMDYGDLLSFIKLHGSVRHTLPMYTCTYIHTSYVLTWMLLEPYLPLWNDQQANHISAGCFGLWWFLQICIRCELPREFCMQSMCMRALSVDIFSQVKASQLMWMNTLHVFM